MSIPYATHKISVLERSDIDSEPSYSSEYTTSVIASGIRAVISPEGGRESDSPGSRQEETYSLVCDPFLHQLDRLNLIKDDDTGDTYNVSVPQYHKGLGLDHWQAVLTKREGL